MFIGRQEELSRLVALWGKKVPSLVTLRGRRRIGKSTLVAEFARRSDAKFIKIEGLQPSSDTDNRTQLDAFQRQLVKISGRDMEPFKGWFEAFLCLDSVIDNAARTVVLLDEISWMGKYDSNFAGELKLAWDNWFTKHPALVFVICGSVSSWIDRQIVRSKAFVGRPTMNLTLRELSASDCVGFWGENSSRISSREILDVLSVTGGVPEYLENVKPSMSADDNIRELCYRPGALLVEEFDEIFNDSIDDNLSVKRKMLMALSNSSASGKEISEAVGIEYNGHAVDFLNELEVAGFISKDNGENPATGKASNICRFRICDNYTRFYLKYIEPHRRLIEQDAYGFISLEQLPGWDSVMGLQFENLVINNLHLLLDKLGLGRTIITSAAPYRQKTSARAKGCQIDFLIQTKRSVYVLEIKRRQYIGEEIVEEMERKLKALKVMKSRSVRPVLIYDGNLSKRVSADGYFTCIISGDELLGRG